VLEGVFESIFEVTEGEFEEYQKECLWSARVSVQRVAKGVFKMFLEGVFEECLRDYLRSARRSV